MKRSCVPEILDSLPHDHPAAIHNRRDLRLINRLMRNQAWFEQTLPGLITGRERVLEVGAGTGELGAALNRRGVALDGLDLWPRPPAWPGGRAWHRADLKSFSGYGDYPVVIGNLIFHQFHEEELSEIGATLRQSCRIIVANEPQRRKLSQTLMAAIGPLLGANHVTLHDGRVSIQAGFMAEELPRALGMNEREWDFACTTTAMGAYRMVAQRRP